MSQVELRGTVLRWGNSYGLRLSRRDLERLHIKLGSELPVLVSLPQTPLDSNQAPVFHLGGHASRDHDALFAKAVLEDLENGG